MRLASRGNQATEGAALQAGNGFRRTSTADRSEMGPLEKFRSTVFKAAHRGANLLRGSHDSAFVTGELRQEWNY